MNRSQAARWICQDQVKRNNQHASRYALLSATTPCPDQLRLFSLHYYQLIQNNGLYARYRGNELLHLPIRKDRKGECIQVLAFRHWLLILSDILAAAYRWIIVPKSQSFQKFFFLGECRILDESPDELPKVEFR